MTRSVERALQLLRAVSEAGHPISLMELVAATGIDKSTALRLLDVLEAQRFVARDPTTRRYTPGAGLFSLATTATRQSEIVNAAIAPLARIAAQTGETTSLHLRVGSERVCVHGIESSHAVRRVLSLGEAIPLFLGPTGKIIMAWLPWHEVDDLVLRAEEYGCDRAELSAQLVRAKAQGYLITVADRTPGVTAISAPIFDATGPTGSITVAGPSERLTVVRCEQHAGALLDCVAQISAALGARPGPRTGEPLPLQETS